MQKDLLAKEPLSQKLIKKSFRAYIFAMFTAPLGYLLRLLASNTLSVSDVWIFYSILSLFGLLACYNDLWLTESLQYFLPKYWLDWKKWQIKNVVFLSLFMQLFTWIIIFLLLFFNAEWLAINHFHSTNAPNIIKTMSFFFLWSNLLQVCAAIFVSFQDTFNSWLVEFSRLFSTLVFAILFWIWASFDVGLFALSRIIGISIGMLVWLIQLWRKYNHLLKLPRDPFDKKIILTQFKYAFWVFLTANIWWLLGNVDQQLVVNRLWAEASWYFTNMLSLLNIFFTVVWPLSWLAFPVTTELSTRKDKDKFKLMEYILYTCLSLISIIMWWIFLVFWQEISVLLFWEKFRFSWELLQILWPCLIFNCLSWLNFWLLAWLWKIRERFFILLVSLVVNVICNVFVLFVLNLDLHAVITVLALSWIIQFILWLYFIYRHHPFHFDWKFFFKNVLIIWILCLSFLWIKNNTNLFIPNQNRWQLLFMLLGICMIYASVIAWFNRWKIRLLRNELNRVRKLKQ